MAYKRKYERGEPITSLDELAEQDFVYWHDKVTPRGWFMSWQLKMTCDALKRGVIYKALKIKEDESNGNR